MLQWNSLNVRTDRLHSGEGRGSETTCSKEGRHASATLLPSVPGWMNPGNVWLVSIFSLTACWVTERSTERECPDTKEDPQCRTCCLTNSCLFSRPQLKMYWYGEPLIRTFKKKKVKKNSLQRTLNTKTWNMFKDYKIIKFDKIEIQNWNLFIT